MTANVSFYLTAILALQLERLYNAISDKNKTYI